MGQHKNKPNNSKKKPNGLRKRLNSASNMTVMLIAGIISIELMYFLIEFFPKWISLTDKVQESAGYWNFLIVLISVPVALVVWHFRDENNRQQIENQRKDINLKEFQKLSEWVSGAHLPEIKTVSKTTNKCNLKNDAEIVRQSTPPIKYTTEETEEYSKQPKTADFDTFSKRDGAVALQISAIYNLLPFFRGDYGESFRLPAFNLLKSAWQAMQQDSLKKLEKKNLSDEALHRIFNELEQKANSPMGVALTHVLLSLNQENKKLNLQDFPEMLLNICLAGMNFQLNGLFKTKNNLPRLDLSGADLRAAVFKEAELQEAILTKADLQGANLDLADLQGADLQLAKLQGTKLYFAKLQGAKLHFAKLQGADLQGANLELADLQLAKLQGADLQGADLQGADLQGANLELADLQEANLQLAKLQNAYFDWLQLKSSEGQLFCAEITADDFIKKIYPDWKKETDSKWDELTEDEQKKVMQQFCDETKMWICNE